MFLNTPLTRQCRTFDRQWNQLSVCLWCPWELNWCKRGRGETDTHTLHKHAIRLCAHPVLFETHLHCTSLHICTLLSSFCFILCFSVPPTCLAYHPLSAPLSVLTLASSPSAAVSPFLLFAVYPLSSSPVFSLLPWVRSELKWLGIKRAAASGVNGFCLDRFNSWLLFWLKNNFYLWFFFPFYLSFVVL